MLWNKNIFFTLIIIFNLVVFANEHGKEKPVAAAGGENGAAAGAPVPEKPFSGRQSEDWIKVQAQLTALKGKVDAQKALVEGLIAQKSHAGGHASPAAGGDDTETLKKEHAAWLVMIEEYNTLNTSFQNRFPEKGAAVGRIYKRINPDNIETLESQMTAEGRLKRLVKKIKKQYLTSEEPSETKVIVIQKKNHSPHGMSEDKKTKDDVQVTDQIILQK
ncbi:MAG: hypothetical protein WA160_02545 [Pseudobdellovibrio sp.]